jgi:hypothetical protein
MVKLDGERASPPGERARCPSSIQNQRMIVGVISDTHGLLRPEALAALRGSGYIVHAGDVGDPAILDKLAEIAPVTAVRGEH